MDSDTEDVDWDTLIEECINRPSYKAPPPHEHLNILPDTGNPHELFFTEKPRTLYDTRATARHQSMETNGGQALEVKDMQANTVRNNERSKTLPTGRREPQILTDGPITRPTKTYHTDVTTDTHQDTTPIDLDKQADHTHDLNITANSRFESWTRLCRGTGRRYPNQNDVTRSISYSRRPKKLQQTPTARTHEKCRICITLETSGKQ